MQPSEPSVEADLDFGANADEVVNGPLLARPQVGRRQDANGDVASASAHKSRQQEAQPGMTDERDDEVNPVGGADLSEQVVVQARLAASVHEQVGAGQPDL